MSAHSLNDVKDFIERLVGALIDEDYAAARGMFTPELAAQWDEPALASAWRAMVLDPAQASMMPETIAVDAMDGWPGRTRSDAGWGYVPVLTEEVNEAVSGIVSNQSDGQLALRTLEFGRP